MAELQSGSAATYAALLGDAMDKAHAALHAIPVLPAAVVEDPAHHARELVAIRRQLTDLWLEVVDSTRPAAGR